MLSDAARLLMVGIVDHAVVFMGKLVVVVATCAVALALSKVEYGYLTVVVSFKISDARVCAVAY